MKKSFKKLFLLSIIIFVLMFTNINFVYALAQEKSTIVFSYDIYAKLMIFVPIFSLLIVLFIWEPSSIKPKKLKLLDAKYYPPKNINSLEMGFLYKGKANYIDVTSLLLYLANKGYIKIYDINDGMEIDSENNDNNKSLNNDSNPRFLIKKIKKYDGKNEYERKFMKALFKNGKKEVTDTMLSDDFSKTYEKIIKEIKDKDVRTVANPNTQKTIIESILIFMTSVVIIFVPIYKGLYSIQYYEIEYAFYLCLPFILASNIFIKEQLAFCSSISMISLLSVSYVGRYYELMFANPLIFLGFIIGVICLIIMFLCYRKELAQGRGVKMQIKQFDDTLTNLSTDKIKSELLKNPNYFYDILPYAYTLSKTKILIDNFKEIQMQSPSWYGDSNDFSKFCKFIETTMPYIQVVLTSKINDKVNDK